MKSVSTLFIVFMIVFCACSSDAEEISTLSRIEISSAAGNRLDITETVSLNIIGYDQTGRVMEVTGEVSWSANNDIVVVESSGLVRPQMFGESIITATIDDLSATYEINVWDSSAPRTDIFVSDVGVNRSGPHQILRYYEYGDFAEVYISSQLSRPQDIVFLEDQGVVLVSNLGSDNINKYDIETGDFIEAFATNIPGPTRMDIGPDGLLYVILWKGGPVKRYNLDGTFVDDFTDISINEAIGMDWDSNGNLYVSSFNESGANGLVYSFDELGVSQGLFVNDPQLAGPTDIWFDDNDNLYVNDWEGSSVRKYDSNGAFLEIFISGLSQPEGVAFLSDTTLAFGASGTSNIPIYSTEGVLVHDLVSSGVGGLVTPNAVVLRPVNYD